MRGEGGRRFRENRKGAGGGGGAAAAAESRRVLLCLSMRRKRKGKVILLSRRSARGNPRFRVYGASALRSCSHACKGNGGAFDMRGPGSGQYGAIFSHGNKNSVRTPSFRRKEKSKIISLKSTLPVRLFGVLLWKLASVDGVDDNLTNRSSTAAVMAPREKVEKAGYAPQSLVPVQKSQLDLAPRNDSSGESTRRVSWVY
ncbi:hypothetical protein NC651_034861 [Populus alba x Populus x berolinensis]|nr:hypothetical protein NC651_034861 [Populus alba x Populus x berolinensis]